MFLKAAYGSYGLENGVVLISPAFWQFAVDIPLPKSLRHHGERFSRSGAGEKFGINVTM